MALPKKQKNTLTLSELYQYFLSPKRKFRDIFQNTLQESNPKAYEIGTTLCRIRDEGILNLDNFSLILYHPLPFELGSGLIQLHHSNLLTTENKDVLKGHASPSGVALVLRLLNSVNLLSTANRMIIQKGQNPHLLASVFFTLFYANLFTQKNFDTIVMHPNLQLLSNKLHGFNRKKSLRQTQLEQLIQSSQQKVPLPYDLNEHKKITITLPLKSTSKRSIYPCRSSHFYAQKQPLDSESLCKGVKDCEWSDNTVTRSKYK